LNGFLQGCLKYYKNIFHKSLDFFDKIGIDYEFLSPKNFKLIFNSSLIEK